MRSRGVALAALGCVMVAGCGSGLIAGTGAQATGTHVTRAQATGVQGARPAAPTSRGGACSGPARLGAGAGVAAWRLGAIRFTSPRAGVALTAPEIPCLRSMGTMGTEVTMVAQPVRLAVTEDGGRHWATRGNVLPGTARAADGQLAAASGPDSWVFGLAGGTLLATRDGGGTWAAQPLAAPVVAAASAGGWLWALSCPPVSQTGCRPVVERMRLPGGAWVRTRPPAPTAGSSPWLAVLSGRAAVVGFAGPHRMLASTADGGALWSARPAPAGPGHMCLQDSAGSFAAAGPDDWWLLCNGGAAAGSSTKALMRSADAGRTWTVAAAITSLTVPPRSGSLPYQDGAVIAAGTPGRLWIATPNTLSTSGDGGTVWSRVLAGLGGYFGQFDVLSGTVAWLLAPGAGLWQTTDGLTWRPAGGTGAAA